MSPLITLLITTRERAIRLEKCLATCVGQDWTDCELLISDNVSTDNTLEVVESYRDRLPIRYINPGKRLGMSEHWEFAIPHASGEYLCVIGDDDGVPSWGLQKMKSLLSEFPGVDAINWYQLCFYYPDLPDPEFAGIFSHQGGDIVQLRSAATTLSLFVAGKHGYSELPGVYHKLARTSLIKEIVANGIIGVAPDISIASVLTTKIESYLYTRTALTIPGSSPSSNGFSTLSQKGDKAQASVFLKETSVPIEAPFNNLSFKFESNWHLMQLETIVKLRRREMIPSSSRIDYVEHLRQVHWEAAGQSDLSSDQLHDDLWQIDSELSKELACSGLSRSGFLEEMARHPKQANHLGMGASPNLRLTKDHPDIFSAMPILENAIFEAEKSGHEIIKRIIPSISKSVTSGSYRKALPLLPEILSAFGGDIAYMGFSHPDLQTYLNKFFNSDDSENHSYCITLLFYILYSRIETTPELAALFENSLKNQNDRRFQKDLKSISEISWEDTQIIFQISTRNLHRLNSWGLLWAAPYLNWLKKQISARVGSEY